MAGFVKTKSALILCFDGFIGKALFLFLLYEGIVAYYNIECGVTAVVVYTVSVAGCIVSDADYAADVVGYRKRQIEGNGFIGGVRFWFGEEQLYIVVKFYFSLYSLRFQKLNPA